MPVLMSARTAGASGALQRRLHKLASGMLASLGCEHRELSILLCDDRAIRELNSRYRKQPKATDVLAFGDEVRPGQPPSALLGDVVISLQTAARQARERRATLWQETAFLLAHGLLHLLGLDHDTPRKASVMNRRTAQLLAAVGLTPPTGVQALAAEAPAAVKRLKHRPKVRSRGPRIRAKRGRKARTR
jgi:probable rRNA maturation factor